MKDNQDGVPVPVRAHIFEIDLIRAVTVFSVVALHCLASTQFLVPAVSSLYLVNLFIHLLHYNREMFMFVTGLVLTYAYFGKPFSAKKFWLRRALLILVPYLFWSIIYVKINNHTLGLEAYLKLLWHDILVGEASYQLYYILLALEFYILFPFFLIFLKKVSKHPWTTLSISFLFQIFFLHLDYNYLQSGIFKSDLITNFILPFQDRIFITYQFFFIFGAFTAIYMKDGYSFMKKFGKFLPFVVITSIILYSIYYYYLIGISKNIFYATSVLQPSVTIYSIVIILFFLWLAISWVKNLKLYKVVKLTADTSFGIYFVHVAILSLVVKYLLPLTPNILPLSLKMGLVIAVTFTTSVLFCAFLLKTPLLAWTIGRGRKENK